MKHALQISVSKKPVNSGIAAVKQVSVRKRMLRFLFGDKAKLTVIGSILNKWTRKVTMHYNKVDNKKEVFTHVHW